MAHRLPPASEMDPMLYREPVQTTVSDHKFTIDYRGHTTQVRTLASYQIWGVVVSHNDPAEWYRFDITHDKLSLDTRDLCMVWAGNVKTDSYRNFTYYNDDYMCTFRSMPNKNISGFQVYQVSNNHLITNDQHVRDTLASVELGDQVYVQGYLVSYSEDRWHGNWRTSSLTRYDTGDGACEVIYVSDLQILHSYNHLWAMLREGCKYLLAALIVVRLLLFFLLPARV